METTGKISKRRAFRTIDKTNIKGADSIEKINSKTLKNPLEYAKNEEKMIILIAKIIVEIIMEEEK